MGPRGELLKRERHSKHHHQVGRQEQLSKDADIPPQVPLEPQSGGREQRRERGHAQPHAEADHRDLARRRPWRGLRGGWLLQRRELPVHAERRLVTRELDRRTGRGAP